jgi:hypothetical protein
LGTGKLFLRSKAPRLVFSNDLSTGEFCCDPFPSTGSGLRFPPWISHEKTAPSHQSLQKTLPVPAKVLAELVRMRYPLLPTFSLQRHFSGDPQNLHSLRVLSNLSFQVALPFGFRKSLNRISQHGSRHGLVVRLQEIFFGLRIALSHFTKHPTYGFVD